MFALVLLMLFASAARAQFTLSGTVKEINTNQPLPGATVSLSGLTGVPLLINQGVFQIPGLPQRANTR